MYLFGKFLTRVPILRCDRYLDFPLSSSSAVPIVKKAMTFGEVAIEESAEKDFEVGQQLEGVMIPKIRHDFRGTTAPPGQPAKDKSLIKTGDLGADNGDDSASVVYMKIGSIALFAAVVSYVAVPMIIRIFQGVLHLFDGKQDL